MTRLRAALLATLALAVLPLATATTPAQGDTDGFSRIRITLSTTSDWATATLQGLDIRVQHTRSSTSGARYYAKHAEWTIVPATGAATAVVDLVVAADGADPSLVLQKGMVGAASVDIDVLNGSEPVRAHHSTLDSHDERSNRLLAPIDPAAIDLGGLEVPLVDDRRLTLAFYYPWFDYAAAWDRSIAPDKPVPPYNTSDAASVSAMVDQAVGAGIHGFAVAWEGLRHHGPVELLIDAAVARPGFELAPLLELGRMRSPTLLGGSQFDPAKASAALREFLDRVPVTSRLQVAGRPVVFAFGMWDVDPRQWAAFRAAVADIDPFLVGDRPGREFPVDGFYEYDPNPFGPHELAARWDEAVDTARLRPLVDPEVAPRLWAATVSPGYDNRASQPMWLERTTWRDGGARYDQTWQAAIGARPDWVVVTSWNEWFEQTHIVPGSVTGDRALEQTASWTARFGADGTATP